jgi:Leucine-rich repeat (LRR) protein
MIIVSAILVSLVTALGIVPWSLVAAEAAEPVADKPPVKSDPVKLTPAQQEVLQTLKQPGRFEFIETPLSAVAEDVKDRYQIELRFDEKAFREKKLGGDTPVTINIRDVNLNNGLWLLSRQLGLTHVIRGNDLLITTPQEAERIVLGGGINPDQIEMWSGNGKVVRALIYPTVLEFIETPLQDVMDYLGDLHDIGIRLDEHALSKHPARPDTPVTCNLQGITLNSGLRLMLNDVGLTHVVSHGMLLITTPEERNRLVQRVAFEPDDVRFSPGNKQVLAALAEETQLHFIQTPIRDVADYLQDSHETAIKFDLRAMKKAGLGNDFPVTKKVEGVTLHAALKEILSELGLAHVVQHEAILVTTPEEVRPRLLSGALPPTDTKTAETTAAADTVATALKKPVTIQCREKPFSELVDVLKKQCEVEIRIDDWGLATAGLKRDFPCATTVKDVSLGSVLQQLLGGTQLGYIVEEDLIVITGREISDHRRDRRAEHNLKRVGAMLAYETDSHDPYVARVYFHVAPGRVTDDVFQELKKLSRLRRLYLNRTKVTDAGMVHLTNFPELRELNLNTRITDTGLSHVATLKNLRKLNLEHNRVTDDGLKHIQGLTELRELYLTGSTVTDAGLRYLAGLEQLEVLVLAMNEVTGAGLEHIAGHQRLRRLEIGPAASGAALKNIADCTELQTLRLQGRGVTDADLEHLQRLTQLQMLRLMCPRLTDAGLKHLAGLTRLTWLDLSRTQVTGVGLSHLESLKLNRLILTDSKINDAGLAHLSGLMSMQQLDLSGTEITDEAIDHLRAWRQQVQASNPSDDDPFGPQGGRVYVILRDTKVTRDAAAALAEDPLGLRVIK